MAKKSNLFFKCHICFDHNEMTSIKTFVWEDSGFTEQSTAPPSMPAANEEAL